MLQVNEKQRRPDPRPGSDARESDAPDGLRKLSDVTKAQAVAAGVASVVGAHFEARLETVRNGAFDRTREFRRPAELRVTLLPFAGDDCEAVRLLRDVELEDSLARSLSVASGEEYRVRLVDKLYGTAASAGTLRLTLQVARA